MGEPRLELVAEQDEILLNQDLEAFYRAIVLVEYQLGERRKLRRPVPPVTAVDQRSLSSLPVVRVRVP